MMVKCLPITMSLSFLFIHLFINLFEKIVFQILIERTNLILNFFLIFLINETKMIVKITE